MDCRELEDRLEALLDGELDEFERRRCARHLEQCPSCRDLTEPLIASAAPPEDLVRAVLASTSGSACGRAESLLGDWTDRRLAATDHQLMAAHLDGCDRCRALAAAMSRLDADLPLLAELRPDPGFVAAVLAATLPLGVRLRRWWAATWPRWVQRPRFASEAAFITTLVLVLVFATPGSPVEALPTKALALARTDPGVQLEAPLAALEEQFADRVKQPVGAARALCEAKVRAWAGAAAAQSRAVAEEIGGWLGTSRELLASSLESADEPDTDSKNTAPNPNQEKP